MGYRLEISTIDIENRIIISPYYDTKYYGYEDLEKSLSYKFLKIINKFTGEEDFDYGDKNIISLNFEEFEMFIKLYNIDLNNRKNNYGKDKDFFINDEVINKLLNKRCEIYVLSWGVIKCMK